MRIVGRLRNEITSERLRLFDANNSVMEMKNCLSTMETRIQEPIGVGSYHMCPVQPAMFQVQQPLLLPFQPSN